MGFFGKIWKGLKGAVKGIFKPIKKVFKKFGKFMGKLGIAGQVAMFFIAPAIGGLLMKGMGALWSGVVGQTATQAANAAVALGSKATATAAQVAAGQVAQTSLNVAASTGSAVVGQATGLLAGKGALVKAATFVMDKTSQFAGVLKAGYQTVSKAVTGAFQETGKWIGGKLGMKTIEGELLSGSWANYSKGLTKSFTNLTDKTKQFWGVAGTEATNKVGSAVAQSVVDSRGRVTLPESITGSVDTVATAPVVNAASGKGFGGATGPMHPVVDSGAKSTVSGYDVNPADSFFTKAGDYIHDLPGNIKKSVIGKVASLPSDMANSLLTTKAYEVAGLGPEEMAEQGEIWSINNPYAYESSDYGQKSSTNFPTFPAFLDSQQSLAQLDTSPKGTFGPQGLEVYTTLMRGGSTA